MRKLYSTIVGLLLTFSSAAQAYHPLIRQGVYWDNLMLDFSSICFFGYGYRTFFSGNTVTVGTQQYHELRGYPYIPTTAGQPVCGPFHIDMNGPSVLLALLRE